eukprot:6486434-Amphidinium_carterae.3
MADHGDPSWQHCVGARPEELDVLEHSLQLGCVLMSTLALQLRDHALLGLCTYHAPSASEMAVALRFCTLHVSRAFHDPSYYLQPNGV